MVSGATIQLSIGGTVIPTTVQSQTGTSVVLTTIPSSTPLADGSPSVTATQILQETNVAVGNGLYSPTLTSVASLPLTITIDTVPPVFSFIANTTAGVGVPYSCQVTTNADSAGAVTYQLTQAPSGMAINKTSGRITWTPTAAQVPSAQVIVLATDPAGNTAQRQFTVLVVPATLLLTAGALTPPGIPPTVSTFVSSGFSLPQGLAFDAAGNLYVANFDKNTISKVTPAGAVSTFVRSGLDGPEGLAFDAAGNLYVANLNNSTISKVTPAGAVSAFVSSGLACPNSLAFDTAGNLYVANSGGSTISKVTPARAVSTFVGAGLDVPDGLAFDAAGNLYVANIGNSTISKVTPAGAASTFVSSGFASPDGLAFDAAGNLFVANFDNSTISEVTPAGAVSSFVSRALASPDGLAFDPIGNLFVANVNNNTISKIAPSPLLEGQAVNSTVFHFTDANPAATVSDYTAVITLGDGNSVTVDSSGVVGSAPAGAGGQIVADAGGGFDVQLSYTYTEVLSNQTFSVQVNAADGASTSAGTSNFSVVAPLTAGVLTPPGSSTVSTFVSNGLDVPDSLAVNAAGNLYVANYGNNTISKVAPKGAVSTFGSSKLDEPAALVFDAAGNLYVANYGNNTISKVTPKGAVSTFVSTGLDDPDALAFDATGNLYIANYGNNTILKVTRNGTVSPFVSTGLDDPNALAFDSADNLYVANSGDDAISKVTSARVVSTFLSSGIEAPYGLAFDAADNLYVANAGTNTILKVTPAGTVSTFAGSGLDAPEGLAFDAAGNLYVTNRAKNTISKITPPSIIEGKAFTGTVFHFTDADSLATAGDYTALVNLGDGKSVTLNSSGVIGKGPAGAGGRIVADAGGGFDVQLSYAYGSAFSNHIFRVYVTDVGGASTSASTPITVVRPVSLSKSTITISSSSIVLGDTATVTLTARDANGNQEPGGALKVAFSLVSGRAVIPTPPPATVTTTASSATAPSLGAASTNGLATDAAIRAMLLGESTVTGKLHPLFES